jgi:hypothetical protein
MNIEKSIPNGFKPLLIVHIIVGVTFGAIFLVIPVQWGSLIGWPVSDPVIYRFLGAAVWALTASSWFAYKETAWDNVKIIVQMEMVWLILGALVALWGFFFEGASALGSWLYFIVLAGLAAGFSFIYSRAR